jgi:hypothetical protein
MNTYLTISAHAIGEATFRAPSTVSLTVPARTLEPATARPVQLPDIRAAWSNVGGMPVRNRAAQQHQGGSTAGFGGCDVTDTKFSTRVGPPSCSPPV